MKTIPVTALFALCALLSPLFAGGKCGTARMFYEIKNRREKAPAPGYSAKTGHAAQVIPACRTFETDHFAIHYTLRGAHAVRIDPPDEKDQSIMEHFNSIRNELPGSLNVRQKDSAAYRALDAMEAGHPAFINKQGQFFEMARDYYIGALGMRAPVSDEQSTIFSAPPAPGKYHIDIAHIAAAFPFLSGEIYALTFPPGDGETILMDNDFLYGTYGGLDSIRSTYRGVTPPLIRNYAREWKQGIKVTAAHEFYHAIQYTYTPWPGRFHYWYEASATGMEEQLAPEINDYLQYLPDLFYKHATFSLNGPHYQQNETYATGIFHSYLSGVLGIKFDVAVWEYLEDENLIDQALGSVISDHGTNIRDLYAGYTQPLLFGQRADRCPFPSPPDDLDLWPVLNNREMALDDTVEFSLPPLAFEVLEPGKIGSTVHKLVRVTNGSGLTLTSIYGEDYSMHTVPSDEAELSLTIRGGSDLENLVLFSNGSWDRTASIAISPAAIVTDSGVSAYPNPIQLKNNLSGLLFTRPFEPDSLTVVTIYSEYGALIKTLELDSSQYVWTWDLRNENEKRISQGIYYYKSAGQSAKSLLALYGSPD